MTEFVCPACRGPLVRQGLHAYACPKDRFTYREEDGIWRFLTPEQADYFKDFIRDYQTVRKAEGRASTDPAYYRSLPYVARGGKLAEMWRMRAASYRTFERRVLRPAGPPPLRALDLGAGSGWLSHRLANYGHLVDAVDLLTNDWDGLGAHRHFETAFRPVQASFDALPFPSRTFDLVVFNASLHYSVEYAYTLSHALDALKEHGSLVIVDTPFYSMEVSGVLMVREREKKFKERYGFRSDALPLENYLTFNRLQLLADTAGLDVKFYRPWFGFRHLLAPYRARLRGRREPARFPVVVLRRKS